MTLLAFATALPHAGPEERGSWYLVTFSGTPVGLGRDLRVQEGDRVYYEDHLEIEVSRLGTRMRMVLRVEEWGDDEGKVDRFRSETVLADNRMLTTGERLGDSLVVQTQSGEYEQTVSMPWERGAVGLAGLDDRIGVALREGRGEFSIRVFDTQQLAYRTSRFVLVDTVAQSPEGGGGPLFVVEQYDDGTNDATMTLWIDENFETYRTTLRQMGVEMVVERINAETASNVALDPDFDVIRESMIRCDGFPELRQSLSEVEFELTFDQPLADLHGFDGPNQRVLSRDGATVDVLVTRATMPGDTLSISQLEPYLESDRYIQIDYPGVRAVADSLSAVVSDDMELAESIARWVNAYITEKTMGRGFSSAAEVLASREGDCTEHSVLLASVLRAAGIPARIVVGLAYDDGYLIGHMWTEGYIDGWHTIDALDLDRDPIRIRVTASPDGRAIDESDVIRAYSLVGGLRARVKHYEKIQ